MNLRSVTLTLWVAALGACADTGAVDPPPAAPVAAATIPASWGEGRYPTEAEYRAYCPTFAASVTTPNSMFSDGLLRFAAAGQAYFDCITDARAVLHVQLITSGGGTVNADSMVYGYKGFLPLQQKSVALAREISTNNNTCGITGKAHTSGWGTTLAWLKDLGDINMFHRPLHASASDKTLPACPEPPREELCEDQAAENYGGLAPCTYAPAPPPPPPPGDDGTTPPPPPDGGGTGGGAPIGSSDPFWCWYYGTVTIYDNNAGIAYRADEYRCSDGSTRYGGPPMAERRGAVQLVHDGARRPSRGASVPMRRDETSASVSGSKRRLRLVIASKTFRDAASMVLRQGSSPNDVIAIRDDKVTRESLADALAFSAYLHGDGKQKNGAYVLAHRSRPATQQELEIAGSHLAALRAASASRQPGFGVVRHLDVDVMVP